MLGHGVIVRQLLSLCTTSIRENKRNRDIVFACMLMGVVLVPRSLVSTCVRMVSEFVNCSMVVYSTVHHGVLKEAQNSYSTMLTDCTRRSLDMP